MQIKEKYDPDGFFDFEQGITPAPDGVLASDAPARWGSGAIER
jgi:Berberine and berberine like